MKPHPLYHQLLDILMDTKVNYSIKIWLRGKPKRMKEKTKKKPTMESTTSMARDIILMEILTIFNIRIVMEWWLLQPLIISAGKETKETKETNLITHLWPMSKNICKMNLSPNSNQILHLTRNQREKIQITELLKIMGSQLNRRTLTHTYVTAVKLKSQKRVTTHLASAQIF